MAARHRVKRRPAATGIAAGHRDLPWRRTSDPYRIWVSEIMLQQTRVQAAIPYYERFFERFPDVARLAAAPEEEVLTAWSGLGYYSRARNLRRAAQQVAAAGGFPRDYKSIRALPGIGDYTAAAIASIAFRVAARGGGWQRSAGSGAGGERRRGHSLVAHPRALPRRSWRAGSRGGRPGRVQPGADGTGGHGVPARRTRGASGARWRRAAARGRRGRRRSCR